MKDIVETFLAVVFFFVFTWVLMLGGCLFLGIEVPIALPLSFVSTIFIFVIVYMLDSDSK